MTGPAQGSLFDAPPPRPSGPATREIPTRDHNSYAAFLEWKATAAGVEVLELIERTALALAAAGRRRIGIRALGENARGQLKTRINNSHLTFIADELVAKHAQLVPLIERRDWRRRRPHAPAV